MPSVQLGITAHRVKLLDTQQPDWRKSLVYWALTASILLGHDCTAITLAVLPDVKHLDLLAC